MTTDFPTAPSAYGLNGPSAAVTVEKSTHASHTKNLTVPLRLMSHNPDCAAGLGFLTIFPSIFTGFAFAIGCVVSSGMLKELAYNAHDPNTVWFTMAGWLAICLAWLVGPLLVFVGPLSDAQEKAMLELGRYATRHHLALGEQLASEANHDEDTRRATAPDLSLASSLNSLLGSVRQQGVVPVSVSTVKEVLVAAAIPMIPVVLTLIPFLELLQLIFKKIF